MRNLESYSHLLYLASEKSRIDNDYIWITILEKLLEDTFSPKLLFLAFRKNIQSLLEILLVYTF